MFKSTRDPGSVPSTHTHTQKYLKLQPRGSDALFWLLETDRQTIHTHMRTHAHVHTRTRIWGHYRQLPLEEVFESS